MTKIKKCDPRTINIVVSREKRQVQTQKKITGQRASVWERVVIALAYGDLEPLARFELA
ncbi:hypothetical protein [Sinorhizobium meliloti]|uniref:hypothetical protein n=1 Tax=Rhizobium meliloti TaxID=382 RepID=UPI0013E2C803|nr:hypothetical protein [Sinorhizobium meliloti]